MKIKFLYKNHAVFMWLSKSELSDKDFLRSVGIAVIDAVCCCDVVDEWKYSIDTNATLSIQITLSYKWKMHAATVWYTFNY